METYQLIEAYGESGQPAILCKRCGRVSCHPRDVKEKFCPQCHVFHDEPERWARNENTVQRSLAPGLWMDANGAVHFSVLDIMKNLGIEDTPRNREDVAKDLKAMLQTITPHTELLERGGRCPHCKGKVLMRKQGQIHCTECGAAFPESELLPP